MMETNLFFGQRIPRVALVLIILASLLAAVVQPASAGVNQGVITSSGRVSVISIQAGESVTLRISGFPARAAITVRMSNEGTSSAGGAIAGTAVTNGEGTLRAIFRIPSTLVNKGRLNLRVELTAKPGQFVSTTFRNLSSDQFVAEGSTTTSGAPSGTLSIGGITITEVDEDEAVQIRVTGAPGGGRLAVWFDWLNNQGQMQGRRAGSINVPTNGRITTWVKIPSSVRDRTSLRIRLQGIEGSNFLAYRWFINATTDSNIGSGAPSGSTTGLPYLRVLAVVENDEVTIRAFRFPAGTYVIRMDKVGSGAKNGIEVDRVKIKSGTTGFTATFDIPSKLEGEDELTIRVQNVDQSGYFAFITFDNED